MNYQADTRRHFELWAANLKAAPDPVGCEQLVCPQCGDALTVRWARNSDAWQIYHSLTVWCDLRGASWYGATRAEAIENFQLSGAGQISPMATASASDAPAPTSSPLAGAATIAGWEVSGLDDEAVNALLQITAEPK